MLKRIDIRKMGSFANFNWAARVGKDAGNSVHELKALNIFYGRNYSGKTTFSRIVRCLETKTLPNKFEDGDFNILTDTGSISSSALSTHYHEVRVYNRDFVDSHLRFLRDNDGDILPFAIIGAENAEVQASITQKETELGTVEAKSGLRYQLSESRKKEDERAVTAAAKDRTLAAKLTAKANSPEIGIKHKAIYKDPNYNAPKLNADIRKVIDKGITPLAEDLRAAKITLLGESALPDIEIDLSFAPSFETLLKDGNELLTQKINPQQPIAELLDNPELQAWVRTGVELHKEKEVCGFCGNTFKDHFWEKVRAHFDKESQELLTQITDIKARLATERGLAVTLSDVDFGGFYADLKLGAEAKIRALGKELKQYIAQLDLLTTALEKRENDIFTVFTPVAGKDNTATIIQLLKELSETIASNNSRTQTLSTDQTTTRVELLLSEVAAFMIEIGYSEEMQAIRDAKEDANKAKTEREDLDTKVHTLEKDLDTLRKKLRDEKRGAERVNDYLTNFFGHDGLKLVAREAEASEQFIFTVMRGDREAFNLSEGECSLVAFCYFMARLDDVSAAGKPLIVHIDDPISSLDSNHIFFVYSLIHSAIEKAQTAGNAWKQINISTHNLDFLKLLKRLPVSAKQQQHFLITATKAGSMISLMPSYLRNYVTEFNFLFEQICRCATNVTTPEEHHCFYNFGNNMRKFLEAYLFFKYPFTSLSPDEDSNKRIAKFFCDPQSDSMVKRLTNEYSHLQGAFDRGMQPIDREEIAKVADFVLGKIKAKDPEQYEALLASVAMTDPLESPAPALVIPIATSA